MLSQRTDPLYDYHRYPRYTARVVASPDSSDSLPEPREFAASNVEWIVESACDYEGVMVTEKDGTFTVSTGDGHVTRYEPVIVETLHHRRLRLVVVA